VISPRAQVPWGIRDARALFFMTCGGFGALFISWWVASGTGKLDRQIAWMVVAIIGIVVIGAANFLWLLAGRRAVGARRRTLLEGLEALDADVLAKGGGAALTDAPVYVAVAGSTRYHRPSCLLVRGKAASPVDPKKRRNVTPCEMCLP
jgi:hypothetical protein